MFTNDNTWASTHGHSGEWSINDQKVRLDYTPGAAVGTVRFIKFNKDRSYGEH
jgi:hypothetical protein